MNDYLQSSLHFGNGGFEAFDSLVLLLSFDVAIVVDDVQRWSSTRSVLHDRIIQEISVVGGFQQRRVVGMERMLRIGFRKGLIHRSPTSAAQRLELPRITAI